MKGMIMYVIGVTIFMVIINFNMELHWIEGGLMPVGIFLMIKGTIFNHED